MKFTLAIIQLYIRFQTFYSYYYNLTLIIRPQYFPVPWSSPNSYKVYWVTMATVWHLDFHHKNPNLVMSVARVGLWNNDPAASFSGTDIRISMFKLGCQVNPPPPLFLETQNLNQESSTEIRLNGLACGK